MTAQKCRAQKCRAQKCRARCLSVRSRSDAGTSLIELIVGMALMAVFMTLFAAAITTMYRSAGKAESVNTSSAQLSRAYTRMDGVVRYASAISEPGRGADGNWYVEVLTTNTGSRVCTQIRMDAGSRQLQQRTVMPNGQTSAFVPVATDLSTEPGTPPFTRVPAGQDFPTQKLMMRLQATSGSAADSATTSQSVVTLTAVNSTLDSPTVGVCSDMVRS